RPLGAHVAQRAVPHRALGNQRRELHDRDLRPRAARKRGPEDEAQGEPRQEAGCEPSHRFSWVEVVSGAAPSSRKNSSCRSSSARALRWSTIVASLCAGSRSGSNESACSSSRRNSARFCSSTHTVWASATYGDGRLSWPI